MCHRVVIIIYKICSNFAMDIIERNIKCVQKHNCLYETSNKDYKNAVLKASIWNSIAEQLNETSEAIKRKWKTMRDGYMKYKKQSKGTRGCEKKTFNFMWSAHLSFLDSCISPRETVSNICDGSQTHMSAYSETLHSLISTSKNPGNSVPLTPGTSSNSIPDLPSLLESTAAPC